MEKKLQTEDMQRQVHEFQNLLLSIKRTLERASASGFPVQKMSMAEIEKLVKEIEEEV